MNKYAARGLLAEALDGKRILVLAGTQVEAREALRVCAAETAVSPSRFKVRYANGAERISCAPGWLVFKSVRSSLRGYAADVVFIDGEAHRRVDSSTGALEELRVSILALGGEVVFA